MGWMIGIAAALAGVAAAAYLLFDTLLPLFIAFALAYAFNPWVDWLQARGLPRTAGVLLIMLGFAAALLVAVGSIIPVLAREAQQFVAGFPDYLAAAVHRVTELGWRYGLRLPVEKDELLARARDYLKNVSLDQLRPAAFFVQKFFSSAAGVVVAALNLLLIPVFFFYVLRDFAEMKARAFDLVPRRHRLTARRELERVDGVFSGYIRGQVSVAMVLGVVLGLGLMLLGVKFGLIIGLLGGLLNVIPYVGQAVGLGLAIVMILVDFHGWWQLLAAPALFGTVNYLEGTFLTPRLVGDRVGLSPLQTILALIVGGEAAGLLGLIVAIPIFGCLKALALDGIEAYRGSRFYRA